MAILSSRVSKKFHNVLIKIKRYIRRVISFIRIGNKHFSIISNNCWGGLLYKKFGMQYETPTVGLIIPPADFIRFCNCLEHYLSLDVEYLKIEESANIDFFTSLEKTHKRKMILGKVDDVELCFFHYKSFEEASTKWNRRKNRVRSPIILKLNDNNGLTLDDLHEFNKLKSKYKTIFITCKQNYYNNSNATIKFLVPHKLKDKDAVDDIKDFKIYNIFNLVNTLVKK